MVLNDAPSKLGGYVRSVVLRRPQFTPDTVVPPIRVTRRDLAIDPSHVAEFGRLCQWPVSDRLPLIYPLMLLFHYHLAVFGHPAFPCSLRQLLGLRSHIVQRRALTVGERVELDVRFSGQRILAKGVEFDIYSKLSGGGVCLWEGVNVYYLRGHFGERDARAPLVELEALDNVDFETRWEAPTDGKWEFAKFCGDLNPAHYYAPWARALGFRGDFAHTQRIVAASLRHLPQVVEMAARDSLRLDIAYKGPVYYGSPLTLKAATARGDYRFDLYCGDADKPAIPGRLCAVAKDHQLLT